MAKATEHEKILRVHDVYSKLINCWTSADIIQFATEKWGIGEWQTYEYIKEARQKLKTNCDVEKADWIAQKLATLEKMAKDELNNPDGAATGNRLAALQMIRTQAQFLDVLK